MGQCFRKVLAKYRWGRRSQFSHKAFEFAPKRSWKYKDANLLGDVDDAVEDGALDTSTSTTSVTMETQLAFPQDSVEEIDTGEIMRSGLLAFSEQDSADESGEDTHPRPQTTGPTQYQPVVEDDEKRVRSASTSSQKIGRFEVMVIEDESPTTTTANGSRFTPTLLAAPQLHAAA